MLSFGGLELGSQLAERASGMGGFLIVEFLEMFGLLSELRYGVVHLCNLLLQIPVLLLQVPDIKVLSVYLADSDLQLVDFLVLLHDDPFLFLSLQFQSHYLHLETVLVGLKLLAF